MAGSEQRTVARIAAGEQNTGEQIAASEQRIGAKIESIEAALLTEFLRWATPVEMWMRTHALDLRAMDLEIEAP